MNKTRHQQLLSLIQRTISTELREMNHELFHGVVVTDVLLSNDGRDCRIWVDTDDYHIRLLETEYREELQRRFMKKYPRRNVPKLHFVKETGDIDRMDQLLDKIESEENE